MNQLLPPLVQDLVVLTQSLVRLHLRQQLHLQQALAEKTVWWT